MARWTALVSALVVFSAFAAAQGETKPPAPTPAVAPKEAPKQIAEKAAEVLRQRVITEIPLLREKLRGQKVVIGGPGLTIRGFDLIAGGEKSVPLDPTLAGPAMRIWAPAQETATIWVRRQFELPPGAHSAQIVVTCDNVCTVHANGTKLGRFERWEEIGVIESATLRPGKNVIAIEAVNQGSNAALAVWVTWTDAKGDHRALVSDRKWRLTEEQPAEGWTTNEFDDRKWTAATEQAPTPFAKNTYGYPPQKVIRINSRTQHASAIASGLEKYRAAKNPEAAHDALREIELAIMQARQQLWLETEARKPKPEAAPSPTKKN